MPPVFVGTGTAHDTAYIATIPGAESLVGGNSDSRYSLIPDIIARSLGLITVIIT